MNPLIVAEVEAKQKIAKKLSFYCEEFFCVHLETKIKAISSDYHKGENKYLSALKYLEHFCYSQYFPTAQVEAHL